MSTVKANNKAEYAHPLQGDSQNTQSLQCCPTLTFFKLEDSRVMKLFMSIT